MVLKYGIPIIFMKHDFSIHGLKILLSSVSEKNPLHKKRNNEMYQTSRQLTSCVDKLFVSDVMCFARAGYKMIPSQRLKQCVSVALFGSTAICNFVLKRKNHRMKW